MGPRGPGLDGHHEPREIIRAKKDFAQTASSSGRWRRGRRRGGQRACQRRRASDCDVDPGRIFRGMAGFSDYKVRR